MPNIKFKSTVSIFTLVFVVSSQALYGGQTAGFDIWLKELRKEALAQNISQQTLDTALRGIKPLPRVIELDRKQPEFTLSFEQYIKRVVPRSRVNRGRRELMAHRRMLGKIDGLFGVQPRFVVAFWGVESDFGRLTGGFSVISALATLAYDGRRSVFFRKELLDSLHILEQGHISADKMLGSWAGAMGQCQFMPSSFRSFAQDYDGDGHNNIWEDLGDVFASTANYLSASGWDRSQTWGREVRLPKRFNRNLIGMKQEKRLSEWQALGVRRADGRALPLRNLMASILQPDGPGGRAYAVYANFQVILKWNRSHSFAISVGRLADKIAGY